MTRHELDSKMVATLRNIIGTKKGRKTMDIHRARYEREMAAMGFDYDATYHGYLDCCDMAELELEAA